MINFLAITLKIISFALVSAILISLPFLSSVRESLFYLFSAVLDNGLDILNEIKEEEWLKETKIES